jgi:Y_Y_Y domain./Two component regulator propeller.
VNARYLAFLFLFCFELTQAQLELKPNIELISVSDGLPSSNTTALLQDRKGFIWISSVDGLSRYDGYSFLHLSSKPGETNSLPNNTIYSIIEDKNGYIWLGQLGGYVTRLNPNTLEIWYTQIKEARETDVYKLFNDSQGTIWAAVRTAGLFRYNGKDKFEFVSALPNLPQEKEVSPGWFNTIGSFYETPDQQLWMGTVNGLHVMDLKTNVIQQVSNFMLPGNPYPAAVQSVTAMDTAYLWCGTYGSGLIRYHFKTKKWKQFLFQSGPGGTNNIINTVLPKDDDELWLTASGKGIGIFNIKTEKFSFYYDPDDFNSGPVGSALIKDRTGTVWATSDKGLHKWSEQQNKFLFTKVLTRKSDNAAYYGLSDILVDKRTGRIILGTMFTEGLTIIDRGGNAIVRDFRVLPQAEPFRIVTDLMQDAKGTIWVLTRDALYSLTDDNRLVLETSILKNFDGNQVPFFSRIIETSNGELWVSSSRHGVYRKKQSSDSWVYYSATGSDPVISNRVTRLLEDQNGNVWMVHPVDGISRFNSSSGEFDHYKNSASDSTSLVSNRLTDITMDSKGQVWISSVEGVSVYQPESNSFRNLTSQNGLSSDLVYAICADADDNIWMNSSLGMMVLRSSNGSILNFNFIDGLKGVSGSFNLRKGEDGKMYALTFQGFYTFYPREILRKPNRPSPMVITGIRNDNVVISDVGNRKELEIDFEKNSVALEFAALNYLNPVQNQYVYKMEGLDNEWTETSSHVVNYSGLPSGSYLFRVKQKNVFDKENEAQLRIVVATPFWRSVGLLVCGYFPFCDRILFVSTSTEENS